MSNQLSFNSLSGALEAIESSVMDSTFENMATSYLQSLGGEDRWQYIEALLTHPSSKVRALGLRVTRRGIQEKILLQKVVQLSFSVERLGELQCWYATILARYPVTQLGRELCKEMEKRHDTDFAALHVRALEMQPIKGNEAKKEVLARVKKFAIEQGLIQVRNPDSELSG